MNIKRLQLKEIKDILRKEQFSELIGLQEESYFDFKKYLYFTDSTPDPQRDEEKWKFALDVSAIANSGGGIIVVGLKELKGKVQRADVVEKIQGVDPSQFNEDAHYGTLKTLLKPELNRELVKFDFVGTSSKLLIIEIVDARASNLFPVIVAKDKYGYVGSDVGAVKGVFFGVYSRDGADNEPLFSAEKIQEKLAGNAYSNSSNNGDVFSLNNKLNDIDARLTKLEDLSKNTNPPKFNSQSARPKLEKYISTKLPDPAGYFYVAGFPHKKVEFPNFFNQKPPSVYSSLLTTPKIRPDAYGWDLEGHYSELPVYFSNGWERMNGDRKILRVTKEGNSLAAASIDGFFNWTMEEGAKSSMYYIGLLPLAEFTGNYFLFLQELAEKNKIEGAISVIAGFCTLKDGTYISHVNNRASFHFGKPLKNNQYEILIREMGMFNAVDLAGELLHQIYITGFSMSEDSLPYLKFENDKWKLDIEKIRGLR